METFLELRRHKYNECFSVPILAQDRAIARLGAQTNSLLVSCEPRLMGKWRQRTARTKNKKKHTRTIWAGVEREVKRDEIDKKAQEAKDPKAEPVPESTASTEPCKGTYQPV